MKIGKILLGIALMASSLTASAQSNEPEYKFVPHWYLQVNGGAGYTLGEAKFGDLISPAAQIGVGYNFNPVLGLRLTVGGWQSKGGWVNPALVYKYNYVAPQLDLTVNLTNAIGGFNPNRIVDLSIFAGAAANIAFKNDEAQSIVTTPGYQLEYLWDGTKVRPFGRFGLDIDFKVSDRVKIGLEGAANFGSDKYNSKKAGNADWYFNALLGVKVALGKTYEKIEAPVEPAPVVAPKPVETPKPVVKKVEEKTINVFFKIRSSYISDTENVKVQEMIKFLKDNPSAKVKVTGYADSGTGNPRVNLKYSQNRADVVEKALLDGGISADRITKEAKGDTVQPFAENDLNRVTIAIAK